MLRFEIASYNAFRIEADVPIKINYLPELNTIYILETDTKLFTHVG